ncbi:hypothetical protein GJU40_14990 [Bacillus lacus]|uniref:Sporadically distributed protein, TIGR04141 family n=1 Tax=Metabacillus lacus TaxID=1983721 RepID=A0A7X2LZW9_9BACI|nr:DUF6119 family protein [Metabacillus lacus]MRX73448.1 hypothetical protein [Metabacillus lacus]
MREIKHKFAIYKIKDDVACNKSLEDKGFEQIKCKDVSYKLYMNKKSKPPKWENMLSQVAQNPNDIKRKNENSSFVLLKTIDKQVYAFTGGSGFFAIQKSIDNDFGMDLISKIIEPDRIKYIRQKPLAGKTVQEESVYKEYYNYNFDPKNWGKISKEILGEINGSDIEKAFGIEISSKFKIRLQGKSSFTINRSLTLEQLDTVLQKLKELSSKKDKFLLYKGFSEISNSTKKKELTSKLIEKLKVLYESYIKQATNDVETEIIISYSDVRDFILSDYYSISYKVSKEDVEVLSLEVIFEFMKNKGIEEFEEYHLSQINIAGFSEEEEEKISDKLKSFLVADFLDGDKNYCFVDQKWYQVSQDLIDIANKEVKNILVNFSIKDFELPNWKKKGKGLETEDDYIMDACKKDLIQMHRDHIKIKGHDKAEACDIVDLRKDEAVFVFVKRGLGTSLRELFAQVRNSIELYSKDKKFQDDAITKIKGKHSKTFDVNKIGVVLAFTDHSISRKRKTPLEKRISTVVKLDLIQTCSFLEEVGINNIMFYEIPHK